MCFVLCAVCVCVRGRMRVYRQMSVHPSPGNVAMWLCVSVYTQTHMPLHTHTLSHTEQTPNCKLCLSSCDIITRGCHDRPRRERPSKTTPENKARLKGGVCVLAHIWKCLFRCFFRAATTEQADQLVCLSVCVCVYLCVYCCGCVEEMFCTVLYLQFMRTLS